MLRSVSSSRVSSSKSAGATAVSGPLHAPPPPSGCSWLPEALPASPSAPSSASSCIQGLPGCTSIAQLSSSCAAAEDRRLLVAGLGWVMCLQFSDV